ncbi:MAG: 2'-5' RNA ligase family protein, partial [Patescibacteria group bacterium]
MKSGKTPDQLSHPFDVVIYPPPEIRERAISVSSYLADWGTFFTLDDGENGPFPHISLYLTEFPLKNLGVIRANLKKYTRIIKPLKVEFSGYDKVEKDYIEASYEKSDKLYHLHRDIVRLLNPLREGLIRDRDRERLPQWSKERQESIRLYGYHSAGGEFRPHMSLAKLKNPDSASAQNLPR